MQTISEILQFLKEKDTNIRKISKETGISSDKLYSWRQGRGVPKADDTRLLLEWAGKGHAHTTTHHESPGEQRLEHDYKDKYIKILEDYNKEMKDKINANLTTVLNNQLATASLLESVLHLVSKIAAPGDEKAQVDLRVSLHREAIQQLSVLKQKGNSSIQIDSESIV